MANYCATARSNYFKVKNQDHFIEFCDRYGLEPFIRKEGEPPGDGLVGFAAEGEAGFDFTVQDQESGEDLPGELHTDLADLLEEGEVAILMSVGNEKLRYVDGYAIAINWKGEEKSVHLNSIYDIAKELTPRPEDITRCEY